jgi:retinol dehydrogenase 12
LENNDTNLMKSPGVVDTPLTPKYIRSNALGRQLLDKGGLKTPEEGSWNQLWAATSKDVVSGQYYELVGILGKRTSKSKDEELREELWGWTALQLKDYTI